MPLIAVGKPNDFELYEYGSPEWFALSEKEREYAWFIDPEYEPPEKNQERLSVDETRA